MSHVMRKTAFYICENKASKAQIKAQISPVPAQLISAFVLATYTVLSLYFLNPKFQVSSHLLWLYIRFCVRPGRKPQRQVFL